MRKVRESRPKFNRKNTQEPFRDIGETETSSSVTSCADSAKIADRYEKIAGLIIQTKELNRGRHASHVCKQGTI